MATSGAAVKLKRLRQRFGISAPRVAVRTHIPWYWRALAIVALLSVSLALGRWVYDAGRSIAGFDSSNSTKVIEELRENVRLLTAELAGAKTAAAAADTSVKIERAAQERLAEQVRSLERDNAALKQDLSFFEGLLPENTGVGDASVKISRLRVEREGDNGPYRFRLLVVHNASKSQRDFKGELIFVLKVRQGGKDAMISHPLNGSSDRFRLDVKHFQRAEGLLPVPADTVLVSVEARIVQNGSIRATQTINL